MFRIPARQLGGRDFCMVHGFAVITLVAQQDQRFLNPRDTEDWRKGSWGPLVRDGFRLAFEMMTASKLDELLTDQDGPLLHG